MKNIIESPFLEFLDEAQQKKIEAMMIDELSKKFETYGYKLVPIKKKKKPTKQEVTITHHKPKNKSKSRSGIAYGGKSYRSLKKACEELGLNYVSVSYYKRKGEPIEDILDRMLAKDGTGSSKPKFVKRRRGELFSLNS
ncbi:hypothetical protein [Pseudobacteriovorax antillogorgiicola]|uniref:Uncharacterized protein n=1 Tax=Pseudobacteriovorax antillogorgiicola TaxID=1513793 RepID=A0A1Y6CRW7_9BACT|nr:hypothetical protein [Pseudobacteriovorax antillogorgiicola]TCS45678.1 hypothetical protein EDD56_12772 [Pseudobacteriovorax antillogorgiicola]SMF73141.1 hypothetical protein SAMN06296036_12771 [Pseudobacteriovorax antillogorgiicola]